MLACRLVRLPRSVFRSFLRPGSDRQNAAPSITFLYEQAYGPGLCLDGSCTYRSSKALTCKNSFMLATTYIWADHVMGCTMYLYTHTNTRSASLQLPAGSTFLSKHTMPTGKYVQIESFHRPTRVAGGQQRLNYLRTHR